MQRKSKILSKDISDPTLREVCERHGTDWLVMLALLCPGQSIYIPKPVTLEEKSRDRFIKNSKQSVRELAKIFQLTPRRIQQIRHELN